MSPPAPPSSLPSTVGPGQVRPRGPGLCPHPPPAPQQPGAPHPPASSLGPGLGCRAWPRQHRPQLGTVPVLHHLSWPRVHPVPYAGVFDGSGAPGAHWPCTGSRVPCPRWELLLGGHAGPPAWAACGVPGLLLLRLGWPGQEWLCPEPSPRHGIPLPLPPLAPAGPLPVSLARPTVSRLPTTSRGPVCLHPCPSTAIMARRQPLLPACPLPAPSTVAVAACSVDRSPPAPESTGQGRALPCARGSAPQRGQGPPRTDPALPGLPRAPSCFAPRQGWVRCWPGQLGSAGACTALALPAPCLCWAEPSVPAAPAPRAPLPPRRALPPLGDNPFRSLPELLPGAACPRCPFPTGWGPVPRAPSPSAAAHRGCGMGSHPPRASASPSLPRTEPPAGGHRTIFL